MIDKTPQPRNEDERQRFDPRRREREKKTTNREFFFVPTVDPYVTKTFQLCCDDGDKDAGLEQKVKKVIISINFGRDLIENE